MGSDYITGELPYNENYTEIFTDPKKQEGNYLALTFNVAGTKSTEEYSTYVEIEGHDMGAVKVTDGYCVFRLTKDDKKLHVYVTKNDDESGDKVYDKFYNLDSLTLGEKSSD